MGSKRRMRSSSILFWIAAAAFAAAILGAEKNPAGAAGVAPRCADDLAQVIAPSSAAGLPAYTACVAIRSQRSDRTRVDVRYSEAASLSVAASVVVICWSDDDWERIGQAANRAFGTSAGVAGGFVWDSQQVANLPARICRILDDVVYGDRRTIDKWVAWAFKNLTHEAFHAAGVDAEAETECLALHRMAMTIRSLGLDRRYAARLAAVSWSRYPRLRTLEPSYFSESCLAGAQAAS